MNNKTPHTLFQSSFLLKAYQNPYVKPQPNNEEFKQRGRQQQLLTCNTPSPKDYSWCFITSSVLTGKKQRKNTHFKKKKKQRTFFSLAFSLLISILRLMLLKQLLNNLSFSLDGPWNCIFTHVSIKVNVFIQKSIYYIYNYSHKSMENCLFRDKYFFSSRVFFFKCWKRLLIRRLLVKNKKINFNSASTTNERNIWWGFCFEKNFNVLIITIAIWSLLYLTPF